MTPCKWFPAGLHGLSTAIFVFCAVQLHNSGGNVTCSLKNHISVPFHLWSTAVFRYIGHPWHQLEFARIRRRGGTEIIPEGWWQQEMVAIASGSWRFVDRNFAFGSEPRNWWNWEVLPRQGHVKVKRQSASSRDWSNFEQTDTVCLWSNCNSLKVQNNILKT